MESANLFITAAWGVAAYFVGKFVWNLFCDDRRKKENNNNGDIMLCMQQNHFNLINKYESRNSLQYQFHRTMNPKLNPFIINTDYLCRIACKKLSIHCEKLHVLGLDCEWVSMYNRRPVALLQLCSVDGFCCLFRLCVLKCIPDCLQKILNDQKIIKVGVGINDDAKFLYQDYELQVHGVLDLRHLYPNSGGLSALSKSLIGLNLDKGCTTWSDWEATCLSEQQIEYAATDAFAGIEIFKKWLLTNASPSTDLMVLLILKDHIIHPYLDKDYKFCPPTISGQIKTKQSKKQVDTTSYIPESCNALQRKKDKSTCITRKTPLYHNCYMHAPDNQLLCSCDRRKADWYVQRGLAEVFKDEPYSIRLLFEPNARATNENEGRYHQHLKQNCCVVCGYDKSYLKHNVVPREYRKHFPDIMKNHKSHDVVLLCVACHQLAVKHAGELKKELALICGVKYDGPKVAYIKKFQKIKNFGKALLKSGDKIPAERKTYLEDKLKNFFSVDTLTLRLLRRAAYMETSINIENYKSQGKQIVMYYSKLDNGLIKLVEMWRSNFLQKMEPKFLPVLWSVSHSHSGLSKI